MLWGSLLKLSRVGREESLVKLGQPCPQVRLPDIVLYNPSDSHSIALYNRYPQKTRQFPLHRCIQFWVLCVRLTCNLLSSLMPKQSSVRFRSCFDLELTQVRTMHCNYARCILMVNRRLNQLDDRTRKTNNSYSLPFVS